MDVRAQFAIEAERSIFPFAEVCRRFGISRPTGYKWLEPVPERRLRRTPGSLSAWALGRARPARRGSARPIGLAVGKAGGISLRDAPAGRVGSKGVASKGLGDLAPPLTAGSGPRET